MPSSSEKNSSPTYSNEVESRFMFIFLIETFIVLRLLLRMLLWFIQWANFNIGSFTSIVIACVYETSLFGLNALQISLMLHNHSPFNVTSDCKMQSSLLYSVTLHPPLMTDKWDLMGRFYKPFSCATNGEKRKKSFEKVDQVSSSIHI